MQQPILVPLDGSDLAEQALPYAQALAEPGAQLILLEVVPEPERLHGLGGQPAAGTEDDLNLLERLARDDLARAATAVRDAGSPARVEIPMGDPAEQILRVAQDLRVGLIVMTTHGRGAIGRWTFGSVADQVTRRSPVPVLVVRPREDVDERVPPIIRRLVVPLDGSALAEEAVPMAIALAKRLSVPIHLISAIDVTGLIPVEIVPTVAFDAALYEETVARLRNGIDEMQVRVRDWLQREGVATTWEVLSGSPFSVIADAVQPGDVIVMTSHGRGGVKRWLLGSVAEKLIREGPVPVILVPTGERHGHVPEIDDTARLGSPVMA